MEWSGGGKWDNCNSIINKYIKKKEKKMGKRVEQTLLQGGHTEGPETYEKMLSITSHQRDAN